MFNKRNPQISFYSTEMYDHLIHEEHFLRHLKQVVDPKKLEVVEFVQMEIDLYRKYSSYYGYVFYLMQKI